MALASTTVFSSHNTHATLDNMLTFLIMESAVLLWAQQKFTI